MQRPSETGWWLPVLPPATSLKLTPMDSCRTVHRAPGVNWVRIDATPQFCYKTWLKAPKLNNEHPRGDAVPLRAAAFYREQRTIRVHYCYFATGQRPCRWNC